MEYQGIVAGIGNKEQNINLIMPEFDSAVNKYIIGKNTIIDGLELDGFTLSAGVCILNGVRGMLENKITLDIRDYVYGRFRKSLIGDTFHIVTSKTELTDDEYNKYLLLYENGISRISRDYPYPEHAKYANQSKVLGLNGVLDAGVTAQTLSVNAHETDGAQSRVATVRYVYNQIQEEIDSDEVTITSQSQSEVPFTWTFEINIKRKAKYCIATVNTTASNYQNAGVGIDNNLVLAQIPEGFRPKDILSNQPFFMMYARQGDVAGAGDYRGVWFTIDEQGNIRKEYSPNHDYNLFLANQGGKYIGYECK